MNVFRALVAATLGAALVAAHSEAARSSEPVPLPRQRPASKAAKPEQTARAKAGAQQPSSSRGGPLSEDSPTLS